MAGNRRVVEEEVAVLEAAVVVVGVVLAVEVVVVAELEMNPEANGIPLHHLLQH